MEDSSRPRFPVYIPSRSRADIAMTPRVLDRMNVPYRIIVEEQQHRAYAAAYPAGKLLILPRSYMEEFDTGDDLGLSLPVGPGAARNFAHDHAEAEGHPWLWTMDDNINAFGRLHQNVRRRAGDGLIFHAMETFSLRYTNIGMAGPQYMMFLPSREKRSAPFSLNKRMFSCQLTRTGTGVRWRSRYNDDVAVTIELLKAGWCTVLFDAFWQEKKATQRMPGGCTEELYADGTLIKSQSIARQYPEFVRVERRFERWHHVLDLSSFTDMHLIRDPSVTVEGSRYQVRSIPNPSFRVPLQPDGLTAVVNELDAEHAARKTAPWKGGRPADRNR